MTHVEKSQFVNSNTTSLPPETQMNHVLKHNLYPTVTPPLTYHVDSSREQHIQPVVRLSGHRFVCLEEIY